MLIRKNIRTVCTRRRCVSQINNRNEHVFINKINAGDHLTQNKHEKCVFASKRFIHCCGNVQQKIFPPANSNTMFQHTTHPKTASIIGAPMTFGQPLVGTDYGPSLLRKSNLLQSISSLGWRVNDTGDLKFDKIQYEGATATSRNGDMITTYESHKNSQIVGKGCQMLAHIVEAELKEGRFPLILGGDHSIAAGSLAGILRCRPNTGVIWVDAHADINTPSMTESGNMHGMPVALLLDGLMDDPGAFTVPGFEWLGENGSSAYPRLDPSSIVYIGLRDVDIAERKVLQEKNIKVFSMHEIDRYGIGQVMDSALLHLLSKNPDRPIHVSYDIDAVDPLHAPATGTAVRGGLTYREAHYVAEAVARSGALQSAEIVELNPKLSSADGSKDTIELAVGLITSLMGKSIL